MKKELILDCLKIRVSKGESIDDAQTLARAVADAKAIQNAIVKWECEESNPESNSN